MNFSEIRDINLPKCRVKSDFSSSLFHFSPSSFPLSFFSFISGNARTGYKSGEVGEKCRFVNYERADISESGRNIQVSLEILEKSVMIEGSKVEREFFPPSLYFF